MIWITLIQEIVVDSAAQGLNGVLKSGDLSFQLTTVASPKSRLSLLLVLANTTITSAPATCRLHLIFIALV